MAAIASNRGTLTEPNARPAAYRGPLCGRSQVPFPKRDQADGPLRRGGLIRAATL